jgi:hypothetical protein
MPRLIYIRRPAGLTALSQVLSATSTGETIDAPAGIVAGDLLVLLDKAQSDGTTPTAVLPTGFTSIHDDGLSTIRQKASYKLADGSEASASITGMVGNFGNAKILLVFRGNNAAQSLTLAGAAGEATAGDPSAQVVGASGGTAPLIVLGFYGAPGGLAGLDIDTRSFTPAKDDEVNSTTRLYAAWKIYDSSPADVTVDMGDFADTGANVLQSCYIACS